MCYCDLHHNLFCFVLFCFMHCCSATSIWNRFSQMHFLFFFVVFISLHWSLLSRFHSVSTFTPSTNSCYIMCEVWHTGCNRSPQYEAGITHYWQFQNLSMKKSICFSFVRCCPQLFHTIASNREHRAQSTGCRVQSANTEKLYIDKLPISPVQMQ